MFSIPEGACVHIHIGTPSPGGTQAAAPVEPRGRPVATVLSFAAVALVAFGAGRLTSAPGGVLGPSLVSAPSLAAPAPRMPRHEDDPTMAPLNPAFREQLRTTPRITPPPGAPSGAASGTSPEPANPFGLHE